MNYTAIEPLLTKLTAELDNPNTLGLMLVGSYSKGTATERSDIDITRFVQTTEAPAPRLRIYEEKVLELLVMPLPEAISFDRPEVALFAVPLWRHAHIRVDKTGRLAQFQREAQESAGLDSEWSALLEQAGGLKLVGTGESLMQARATATLKLYASTAKRLHDLIQPEHQALVERALEAIQQVNLA